MTRDHHRHDEPPDFPVWPGDHVCKPRAGPIAFDAYNTSPDGLPAKTLGKDAVANGCSQVCLPSGVRNVAAHHGMKYGAGCFGENDNSLYPTFADGSLIPAHTPVCPGPHFVHEGTVTGVQFFTWECTGGDVIDYGAPYR